MIKGFFLFFADIFKQVIIKVLTLIFTFALIAIGFAIAMKYFLNIDINPIF